MKKFSLIIIAVAIALTSTVAKAQEPTTPEQVFEFLNHKLPANFITSIEPNALNTDDEVLFEDGSWRFHEFTGCLENWDCDDTPNYIEHIAQCTYLDEITHEDFMEYDRYNHACKVDPRVTSTNYVVIGIIRTGTEVQFTYLNSDVYELHIWLPIIIG